jgi:hypothetical protein
VYEDIKPKKRMAALRAAILFLGFSFVLIPKHKEEATDDIREKGERG